MTKEVSEINWDEIINKFCKEHNIMSYQLFYQRKKLQRETKPTFHAIDLNFKEYNEQTVINEYSPKAKDIRIELGKDNIYTPANETALLSDIIRPPLIFSCNYSSIKLTLFLCYDYFLLKFFLLSSFFCIIKNVLQKLMMRWWCR